MCLCREGFGQGILVLEHSSSHAVKFFKVPESVRGYSKGVPDPTYDCSRIKFSCHALRHGGPDESSYPVGYLTKLVRVVVTWWDQLRLRVSSSSSIFFLLSHCLGRGERLNIEWVLSLWQPGYKGFSSWPCPTQSNRTCHPPDEGIPCIQVSNFAMRTLRTMQPNSQAPAQHYISIRISSFPHHPM
jgi:hypothetical protein